MSIQFLLIWKYHVQETVHIFGFSFLKKFLQNKETHTNADRVVGQTAVVTEDIDNLAAHGRVEVLGNDWAARSTENVRIQKGTKVQVVRIEGVKLIVTPVVS